MYLDSLVDRGRPLGKDSRRITLPAGVRDFARNPLGCALSSHLRKCTQTLAMVAYLCLPLQLLYGSSRKWQTRCGISNKGIVLCPFQRYAL